MADIRLIPLDHVTYYNIAPKMFQFAKSKNFICELRTELVLHTCANHRDGRYMVLTCPICLWKKTTTTFYFTSFCLILAIISYLSTIPEFRIIAICRIQPPIKFIGWYKSYLFYFILNQNLLCGHAWNTINQLRPSLYRKYLPLGSNVNKTAGLCVTPCI